MRKLFALILSLVVVFSLATTALADGPTPITPTGSFKKNYTITGGGTSATVPNEILAFTAVQKEGNPAEATTGQYNITVGTGTDNMANTQVITANDMDIPIHFPTYDKVGRWNYTITELDGKTQGVTYDPRKSFDLEVLVTYQMTGEGQSQTINYNALQAQINITTKKADTGTEKVNGFTNAYDLGQLTITKTVDGNMAGFDDEFQVDVTFKLPAGSTNQVKSDISYSSGVSNAGTVSGSDITVDGKTVTVTVKDKSTVVFENIPKGVEYTIKEHSYADKGYEAAKYTVNNGEETTNENGVSESNTKNDQDTVAIRNTKNEVVHTGVVLDNAPYVLLLAVAVVGMILFASKKRQTRED